MSPFRNIMDDIEPSNQWVGKYVVTCGKHTGQAICPPDEIVDAYYCPLCALEAANAEIKKQKEELVLFVELLEIAVKSKRDGVWPENWLMSSRLYSKMKEAAECFGIVNFGYIPEGE